MLKASSLFITEIKRSLAISAMKVKRVCVIGAGAAGLAAIRHIKDDQTLEGCLFEQTNSIGGVWKYTDKIGIDEHGMLVHSTAYKGLRTNLPKEIMGFLDYPFPQSENSYISHDEVLRYLETYSNDHKLMELIQFTTRVKQIVPDLSTQHETEKCMQQKWKVTTEDVKTKNITEHKFDAIMVCNGHYTKPLIPPIENLDSFQGEIRHSRDYRTADSFAGKRVVVLGGGPSAIDISIEIAECASQVILSCKNANYKMPESIGIRSPVVSATQRSLITAKGEELECDILFLCSGYLYDFPFLSPECGITVEKGKYIYPLYRHLINAKFPSMTFIGIPFTVCPFPQFDCQIRYFLKVLKRELPLPSENDMLLEIKKEELARHEKGIPFHHSHKLGDSQWKYNKKLAEDGGFSHLIKPVIQKVYDKAGSRRGDDPANYKYDQVAVIDDENFEDIEKSHWKR